MRYRFALASLLFLVCCSPVRQISWQKHSMDGHMTGATAPNADNVSEALGKVGNGAYFAPNGKVFNSGTVVDVAGTMIDVQPSVARLKEVVGHSVKEMSKHGPESELSNLIADVMISEVAGLSGKKVDVSFINMGGIRADMPVGDVLLDDVVSILPFKNRLCYVLLEGRELRSIYEKFAKTHVEGIGGVRLVYENRTLLSCEVGGKALDDDALYGVATVDFLLDGGDDLFIAKNSRELIITEELIGKMLEKYVRRLTAEGKAIDYSIDGRVVWK